MRESEVEAHVDILMTTRCRCVACQVSCNGARRVQSSPNRAIWEDERRYLTQLVVWPMI